MLAPSPPLPPPPFFFLSVSISRVLFPLLALLPFSLERRVRRSRQSVLFAFPPPILHRRIPLSLLPSLLVPGAGSDWVDSFLFFLVFLSLSSRLADFISRSRKRPLRRSTLVFPSCLLPFLTTSSSPPSLSRYPLPSPACAVVSLMSFCRCYWALLSSGAAGVLLGVTALCCFAFFPEMLVIPGERMPRWRCSPRSWFGLVRPRL